MSVLQRSLSVNTSSSTTSVDSTSLIQALAVPYTRRRVTAEQLKALNKLFNSKSHPSRDERVALANEMGMQLKTVTNWFQNKRQTSKKKSLVWSEESRPNSNSRRPRYNRSASTPPQTARRLHPTLSLDHIAGLYEKPAGPTITTTTSQRPPLTPRNTSRRTYAPFDNNKNELWQHMPSSPIGPPSSPSADSVRLSILPSRFQTKKSLEWACAKARAERQSGQDDGTLPSIAEVDQHDGLDQCGEMETDNETDTESELEEAITPNASANFSPGFDLPCKRKEHIVVLPRGKENIDPNLFPGHHQSQDVEAAMVLLGFMSRR